LHINRFAQGAKGLLSGSLQGGIVPFGLCDHLVDLEVVVHDLHDWIFGSPRYVRSAVLVRGDAWWSG
jgi:hypothetical protein